MIENDTDGPLRDEAKRSEAKIAESVEGKTFCIFEMCSLNGWEHLGHVFRKVFESSRYVD